MMEDERFKKERKCKKTGEKKRKGENQEAKKIK